MRTLTITLLGIDVPVPIEIKGPGFIAKGWMNPDLTYEAPCLTVGE